MSDNDLEKVATQTNEVLDFVLFMNLETAEKVMGLIMKSACTQEAENGKVSIDLEVAKVASALGMQLQAFKQYQEEGKNTLTDTIEIF